MTEKINWDYYFEYSEDSPSGLIWKVDKGKRIRKGQTVGCNDNNGYWKVRINKQQTYAHRIVWVLHYGSIDNQLHIDHIDGNPSNNIIDNLRLVDWEVNNKNKRISFKNTSGVSGVWKHDIRGFPYYRASINNGKQRVKTFSINKYGHDRAFELACEWRENMIAELDGYTDRHGK